MATVSIDLSEDTLATARRLADRMGVSLDQVFMAAIDELADASETARYDLWAAVPEPGTVESPAETPAVAGGVADDPAAEDEVVEVEPNGVAEEADAPEPAPPRAARPAGSVPPADEVIETFGTATEENQIDGRRVMQVVHLPDAGEVWMTGDLHDNRRNFDKLVRAADLANHPDRHLVLHELIHGDRLDANGAEDSWQTLYKAAALKCDHPGQVHFLLANHDLAQVHGEGIMKAGSSVCEAFTAALKRDFGPNVYHRVNVALIEFLLSLPLAIRAPNGLFFCHSLPTDEQVERFDYTVFDRPLVGADYKRRTGPVYQLIWGRGVTPAGVDTFLANVNATAVVTGHQSQEGGFLANGDRHLIIASEHNQGVFLPLDLAESYTAETMVGRLRKFVALE